MTKEVATRPIDALKNILGSDSVREQFRNALQDNAPLFTASVVDLFTTDSSLQRCDPGAVVKEALKSAVLKLPVAKVLGFSYIIPYNGIPSFQLGYKGLIQLAKRSGAYQTLNAGWIYQGEIMHIDRITGNIISISGKPDGSGEIVGYFAYFKEVSGFEKSFYRTKEEAEQHAQKYSASYRAKKEIWRKNPNEMHRKGVLRALLSQWGTLSIEMSSALANDINGDSAIDTEWHEVNDTPGIEEAIQGKSKETGGIPSLADLAQGKQESKPDQKKAPEKPAREVPPEPEEPPQGGGVKLEGF